MSTRRPHPEDVGAHTTWFTADTHFGHARVIALSRRPFADVAAMDEALIAAWNDRVGTTDVVWHLGDFAFGDDAQSIDAIFARLNGIKHLIVGNHDDGRESVLTLPWASVSSMASTIVEGVHVAMCHYPMKTWPRARKGAIHLFGHTHGSWGGTDRSLDVGVDAWSFKPVSLAEIRRRLRTLPNDPDFDGDGGTRR